MTDITELTAEEALWLIHLLAKAEKPPGVTSQEWLEIRVGIMGKLRSAVEGDKADKREPGQ